MDAARDELTTGQTRGATAPRDAAASGRPPAVASGAVAASVRVARDLCKGCGLCVAACPEKCLSLSEAFNRRGYRFVAYAGKGCTGCGVCFYTCPEPAAVEVTRKVKAR